MKREYFNTGWKIQPVTGVFNMAPPEGRDVTLPHDAMIEKTRTPDAVGQTKAGYFPSGSCEYVKRVYIPAEYRSKRVTLEFEGSYNYTTVYVNGQFAGQCPYGYSNFYVAADSYLRYDAENEIKVIVRSNDDTRWYSGMGLYRNVRLIVSEFVHVALDGLQVSTASVEDDMAKLKVALDVANEGTESRGIWIRAEVMAPDGNLVATETIPASVLAGKSAHCEMALYVLNPQLWNVDTPDLYHCRITLLEKTADKGIGAVLDEEETTFGIRTLTLDPFHGLRINGEVVKMRGACIHHDNGVIGAATIERAEERRIEKLKEAGFNAIRSAHHPAGKALLDACDRLGMLVMDECFDMWTEQKSIYDYSLHFPLWWEHDVTNLVKKDFNHPSVVMYSIGNEIPDIRNAGGNDWGRKIANKLKELDPTRYTINSLNGFLAVMDDVAEMIRKEREEKAEREAAGAELNELMDKQESPMRRLNENRAEDKALEESSAVVDIVGYNYMTQKMVSNHEDHPNWVFCGSETFTKDIAENWKVVTENPYVIGDFCWTGWDYLGEAGIGKVTYEEGSSKMYPAHPWFIANCGDIDILGNRRPSSFYKEIVFGLRKDPYIAVLRPEYYGKKPNISRWAWSDSVSSWSFEAFTGKPVQLEVYSDGDEVELYLNDISQGKKSVGERIGFCADFELIYEPGELKAVSYKAGEVTGEFVLCSASGPVCLSAEADRTEIKADTTDLAYISITLQDAEGNLYSDKDCSVTVTVEGSGHLQGLGSRQPCTEETFMSDTHTTYDGRALAVIRPDAAGTITVTVSADKYADGSDTGMKPQIITIEAV